MRLIGTNLKYRNKLAEAVVELITNKDLYWPSAQATRHDLLQKFLIQSYFGFIVIINDLLKKINVINKETLLENYVNC